MTIDIPNHKSASDKCKELAALVARHTDNQGNGAHTTAIDSLVFMRESDPATAIQTVSEPLLSIMVQGKKEVLLNEETYRYGVAQYLVVSVDLPLSGYIIEATPNQPYLGFKLKLDPAKLSEIIVQTNPGISQQESVRGCFISDAEPSLIDCAIRLTQLLDTPQDIPFLAPLIVREIYYRLLIGEQGEAVRQIATAGSNMQRIAEVIKRLKADFAKPLRIKEFAEQANMSASSFHRHFKAVTSMSPLQYQKQLRLMEARRLMLSEDFDAIATADQVGYESPSQFSREYARMFGAPPMRDVERLRTAWTDNPMIVQN
ncbi:MAG: AraC family transcriptional regulator [Chroococcidiopsis sp.]